MALKPLIEDSRGADALAVLLTFLSQSYVFLLGRIDARGVVVDANLALRSWLPAGEPEGRPLEEALAPDQVAPWRAALAEFRPPGQVQAVELAFGPAGMAFRCQLSQAADTSIWLFGEPAAAATPEPGTGGDLLRLSNLAHSDALTGLANRRMADLWLAEAVHLAGSCKVSLACVMVDIDHFKVVNDTFGHGVGDQVLRAAAGCLTAGVRGGDHVARLGGDEFLLLLPDTDLPGAVTIAERLRASLASLPIPPLENPVTASFGVTQLWAGDGPESLRGRADQALLLAKRNGRNRVETL